MIFAHGLVPTKLGAELVGPWPPRIIHINLIRGDGCSLSRVVAVGIIACSYLVIYKCREICGRLLSCILLVGSAHLHTLTVLDFPSRDICNEEHEIVGEHALSISALQNCVNGVSLPVES